MVYSSITSNFGAVVVTLVSFRFAFSRAGQDSSRFFDRFDALGHSDR